MRGIQLSATSFLFTAGSNMPNYLTSSTASLFMVARNASANTGWNMINLVWGPTLRYHLSFNGNDVSPQIQGLTLLAGPSPFLVGRGPVVAPSATAIIGFTTSSSLHVNGSSNGFGARSLSNASDSTRFTLGDDRSDSNISSNIVLYEIVGMNTNATTLQRQQIEGYFAWKWDLVASLPADHPYKTFRP
jgi:hypothetical protein